MSTPDRKLQSATSKKKSANAASGRRGERTRTSMEQRTKPPEFKSYDDLPLSVRLGDVDSDESDEEEPDDHGRDLYQDVADLTLDANTNTRPTSQTAAMPNQTLPNTSSSARVNRPEIILDSWEAIAKFFAKPTPRCLKAKPIRTHPSSHDEVKEPVAVQMHSTASTKRGLSPSHEAARPAAEQQSPSSATQKHVRATTPGPSSSRILDLTLPNMSDTESDEEYETKQKPQGAPVAEHAIIDLTRIDHVQPPIDLTVPSSEELLEAELKSKCKQRFELTAAYLEKLHYRLRPRTKETLRVSLEMARLDVENTRPVKSTRFNVDDQRGTYYPTMFQQLKRALVNNIKVSACLGRVMSLIFTYLMEGCDQNAFEVYCKGKPAIRRICRFKPPYEPDWRFFVAFLRYLWGPGEVMAKQLEEARGP